MKALSLSVLVLALSFAISSHAVAATTANAGPDQAVVADATSMASVTLDGSGSTDSGGLALTYTWTGGFTGGTATGVNPVVTFGVGVFSVTLSVDNGQGGVATDTVQITVTAPDTTPPVISSVTANPAMLWPPNHKYRLVTVAISAFDAVDPAPVSKIISVTSNEPSDAFHKGTPDFVITGSNTVKLRSERLGQGTGRIYTITVQSTDSSNNSSTATVTVTVPHDKRHGNGNGNGNGHGNGNRMTTDQTF